MHAGGDDGSGPLSETQKQLGLAKRIFGGEAVQPQQRRVQGQAGGLVGLPQSGQAVAPHQVAPSAADQGNTLMAEPDQMGVSMQRANRKRVVKRKRVSVRVD